MITVHHLDDSRSQRILWLLEELGLSYDITQHKRDPNTRLAPSELRKIRGSSHRSAACVTSDQVDWALEGVGATLRHDFS